MSRFSQSYTLQAPACALHGGAQLHYQPRRYATIAQARTERCQEVAGQSQESPLARRAALVSLAAAVAAVSWQPAAYAAVGRDALRYGTWDGKSAATGSCAIGDAGNDCRKQLLGKDGLDVGTYGTADSPRAVQGTAVPEIQQDSYAKQLLQVADVIQRYADSDPFDPERPKIVKTLKQEGGDWASKYARGGNARKQSARRFYIAYDALLGHLVSNGMAPMPKPKMQKVLDNIVEAKGFLKDGR